MVLDLHSMAFGVCIGFGLGGTKIGEDARVVALE